MNNETPNADRDNVLRRVQKLLAIAQDTRANPNEAAAAASMAEKLMRKFQIDNAELIRKELQQSANFVTADVFAKMKAHQPSKVVPVWANWIAARVAQLFDCGARLGLSYEHASGLPSACIRFYGFALDVKLAAWTFDYLRDEVVRGTRQFQKEQKRSAIETNSFRKGFVIGILSGLDKMIESKHAETSVSVTGTELTVAKAQAVAEHFGEFNYSKSKSSAHVDGNAYHAGVREGSAVDVGRRAVEGAAEEDHLALSA